MFVQILLFMALMSGALAYLRGDEKYNLTSGISRDDIIWRAQNWVDRGIPYSQTAYTDGYRQDCSGYVSMAWASSTAGGGHTTYNMPDICTKVSKWDLRRGDAILSPPSHVLLFDYWVDGNYDQFMQYAEVDYGQLATHKQGSFQWFENNGYFPCRYNNVQG